jgi:type I restriction enzyme R subunit
MIPADNVDRAKHFYHNLLGWKIEPTKNPMDPSQITEMQYHDIITGAAQEGTMNTGGLYKRHMNEPILNFVLVDNFQQARKVRYHKALVDIISMVKHAAREEEPLYTAEERIHRVLDRMTLSSSLTADQQQWLDKIREHLIANLSISKDDFDIIPIFANEGGWGRANRVFNGELPGLIRQWNEAIAA